MKQDLRTARWDIYPKCNLNCIHCSAKDLFDEADSGFLDENLAIVLLDKLKKEGITHLNILGREPFLYPHISSILSYAREIGFQVDITTNGTMLKENDLQTIATLGLRVYFSIDGSSPQTNDVIRGDGTFRKTIASLKKLAEKKKKQKAPVMICVNTVLTQINAQDIPNIISFCSQNEVSVFKLSHMLDLGNATENLNRLYLEPAKEFEVAEQVAKIASEYPSIFFDILSDKPLFLEYLYKKYKFVTPLRMSGCKACLREIYIDPMGKISPCLGTSTGFFNSSSGYYLKFEADIFNLENKLIHNNPFYSKFKSLFPLEPKTYEKYIPCNSCPYLTSICYPCPLDSMKGFHREEICLIAKEKLDILNGVK